MKRLNILSSLEELTKMFEKVKALTGGNKSKPGNSAAIEDKNGNMVSEGEKVMQIWKNYIEELYTTNTKKNGKIIEEEILVDNDEKGPMILRSKVDWAIRNMKNKKATGIDDIPAELLKALSEEGKEELWNLCSLIYEEGYWPTDFNTTIMIPIPKKSNANECKLFRTICLIPHASKIMLKILQGRIQERANQFIGKNQFGFRRNCETRDAIGVLRRLIEKKIDFNEELSICFVDFEKAFDRVKWDILLKVMRMVGIDWKDRRLIENLYEHQSALIRMSNNLSDKCKIEQVVLQDCLISPTLFAVYIEEMMNEAMEPMEAFGIKVGRQRIRDIRFADDQAMLANTKEELQKLLDRLNETSNKYNMRLNVEKTKTICVSRCRKHINLAIAGKNVEQESRFLYLGAVVTEDGLC